MKKIAVKCKTYEQARQVFEYFDKDFFKKERVINNFKAKEYPIYVANDTEFGNLVEFVYKYNKNYYPKEDFKQMSFKKFKRKYLAPCRLKIRIEAWQNVAIMQVLEQDEKLRDKGVLFEHDGFKISSFMRPELLLKEIYVKGSYNVYDSYVVYKYFKTNQEAKEYVARVKEVVKKFNEEGIVK